MPVWAGVLRGFMHFPPCDWAAAHILLAARAIIP
jgi:hypothetical protein